MKTVSDETQSASDTQFHLLADAMPQIVWMMQPDGWHTYFNKKWTHFTGLSLQDSLGHGWTDLIHPADSLRAAKLREQAAQADAAYEVEYRLRRADGVYRWMLGRAQPLCDAGGQRTQWMGTLTDIDDLKQAAEIQEKALSMLRIAGQVAHLGGWTIELPGRTLNWSDENCLIHEVPPGYKPSLEEGIGFFFPEDRATVMAHVDACAQHGTPYEFVLPKLTAKGRRIWVRSIGEAVRDAAGQIVGIQGAFQDITRKRAEQTQLRLLETAVSRLNDMVMITEAEPFDEMGRGIVFVNDAFVRYTGYSREEALGNTSRFLLGPKSECVDLERIRAAMKNWQPVRAEIVSYTKAGKELWLDIDFAPIADEEGRFTHWVAVARDITERRRQREEILSLNSALEERVQQRTAQLKFANKELEAFSHSVSHDLRNPLSSINGFSNLLGKTMTQTACDHPLTQRSLHYLARIRAGVLQMGELIDALLSLAHLSRTPLRSEPVNLSALAADLLNSAQEREPGRVTHLHVETGLFVQGDPRLLRQVLDNLLGNAWKFSAGQARTEIAFGHERQPSGELVYFVRDSGAGFDMAYAEKLFGAFQRLHSPSEFSGAGMGLATVHRIVARHGGRIWGESTVGRGATFYFTLDKLY